MYIGLCCTTLIKVVHGAYWIGIVRTMSLLSIILSRGVPYRLWDRYEDVAKKLPCEVDEYVNKIHTLLA